MYTGYHGTYIDHIFVSYGFLSKYTITDYDVYNINLSDHMPIMMDFKKNDIDDKKKSYELIMSNENKKKQINSISIKFNNLINLDNIFVDIRQFMNIFNYNNITILPKGSYIVHGTNVEMPYEINDNQLNATMSFTHMFFPGESFMSRYGSFDPNSFKRILCFKTTRDIQMLNLYNTNMIMQTRYDTRHNFLINFIKFINQKYGKIFDLEHRENNSDMNEHYQLINQIVMSNILYHYIDYSKIDDVHAMYNKDIFYGIIISDMVANDYSNESKVKNNKKTFTYYKNHELYEGIEIQLFFPKFFTKLEYVYYKGILYHIDDYKKKYML